VSLCDAIDLDEDVAGFEIGFGGGGVGLDFSDSGAVVLGEGDEGDEKEEEFHGGREWQIWKRGGMIFNAAKCDSVGVFFLQRALFAGEMEFRSV
jgi:CobQ-like glutamine amidotransferase family enzyme